MPSPFPLAAPNARGAICWLSHHSAALADNPLGDPARRDIIVYTPPDYDGAPLPVLLILPAFAGTGEGLLARSLTDVSVTTQLDHLIANGMKPCLAVLPDAMTSLGGSQYVDSVGSGRYATWIAQEVIPLVEAEFATTGRRAAVGRSSGGFGALHLALTRPGLLHAVGSIAGDMGFDLAYLGDIAPALSGIDRAGGLAAFRDWFWAQARPSADAFAALNLIAMSCCYSPDAAAKPLPCQLPVDLETGEVRFDVLASWRAYDPIIAANTDAGAAALRELALLWIEAGDRDEHQLHRGARRLSAVLNRRDVPHEHRTFPGGHRGTAHRYSDVIPPLISAITR